MSATVTASLKNIKIDPGTTADRAEVRRSCGATGRPYVKGGTFTCGVRYLRASIDQPRQVYSLTVTTVWPVTGNAGQAVVPFAYDPVEAAVTRDVPVGEVQSTVRRQS
jgi:enoyl reductase